MPSYAEIMKLTGYRSKAAVHYAVNKLVENKFLKKDSTGRLTSDNLGKNLNEVKVLGLVEAGFPSPAEEELSDTMSLDEYLIENKEATYILRVKGDSMIEAGILEGDTIIVRKCEDASNGDIVVALVDEEEATLKRLRRRGDSIALEAANPAYETRIFGPDRVRVQGRLVGLLRRY